jgi:hypothetical protein
MQIVGKYSFNGGAESIPISHATELDEILTIISNVNAARHKTKISKEKTMPGKRLYKPGSLNKAFKRGFTKMGWESHRIYCDYPTEYYMPGYTPQSSTKGAFREMDFVKNRLGVEVQFGKYAFMVYNVCAKMTIFHNEGIIDQGVEIVPIKDLVENMSTGVSYFEQFVWDLEHRGVGDIDIPVLILGVAL